MALNGINLPLALTGTEWVWNQVWQEWNFTSADLAPFFSGPAFLPWYRMGNMRGWGGPLTQSWMNAQKNLQIQVLARQRGLGMRPVLGAFAGFVPAAFATRYPHAKLTRAPAWANFAKQYGEVYQLDATDPLFKPIGQRFIELQSQVYGTDHIYSCDTFNEMDPPTGDLAALKASSSAVYGAMAAADKDAIWLMQGWLFIHGFWTSHADRVKAYLSGAPTPTRDSPRGMWVLDLFGSTQPVWNRPFADAYYGKPFILCTLLNFGGQQGLFGNMDAVTKGVDLVLAANAKGTANGIGVGITMEGIWTNYGVFEKALSLSWQPVSYPGGDEAVRFATRRYGGASEGSVEAWTQSLWPLYHGGPGGSGHGSAISSLPKLVHTGPPPPPPAGYKYYSRHGYWGSPSLAAVCTITKCAGMCSNQSDCAAFEVYVNEPDQPGNCYLFTKQDLKLKFTDLSPCQTFVKDSQNVDQILDQSDSLDWPEPRSVAEHYALNLRRPGVPVHLQHPTARVYDRLLAQTRNKDRGGAEVSVLARAWTSLMKAIPELGQVALFRFDLVDVARAVVAANFSATLSAYQAAFSDGDRDRTSSLSTQLLAIIDDYDLLLSSNEHFMLGRWIGWARNSVPGETAKGRDKLEFNARNQITLWGPRGEINDYAKKEWGGLVSSYYKKRYTLLFNMADDVLSRNATWYQGEYNSAVLTKVEMPWSNDTTLFPSTPQFDLLKVIGPLYQKYVPTLMASV